MRRRLIINAIKYRNKAARRGPGGGFQAATAKSLRSSVLQRQRYSQVKQLDNFPEYSRRTLIASSRNSWAA